MAKKTSKKNDTPKYAFDGLDRVFHEKARLGILTSLVTCEGDLNFGELKELCGLTDGNLNRHLKVLLEAKVISVKKTGQGRNTNSDYRLTKNGKAAFLAYIAQLEDVVRKAQAIQPETGEQHGNEGLAY